MIKLNNFYPFCYGRAEIVKVRTWECTWKSFLSSTFYVHSFLCWIKRNKFAWNLAIVLLTKCCKKIVRKNVLEFFEECQWCLWAIWRKNYNFIVPLCHKSSSLSFKMVINKMIIFLLLSDMTTKHFYKTQLFVWYQEVVVLVHLGKLSWFLDV